MQPPHPDPNVPRPELGGRSIAKLIAERAERKARVRADQDRLAAMPPPARARELVRRRSFIRETFARSDARLALEARQDRAQPMGIAPATAPRARERRDGPARRGGDSGDDGSDLADEPPDEPATARASRAAQA